MERTSDNQSRPSDLSGWVQEHWTAVYALLYRLSGNRHDAEDLAQETFVRALGRTNSFQAGTNRRAWLMRIATNAFLDQRRHRKALRIGPIDEQSAAAPAGPVSAAENRELGEALSSAIAALPETARIVFLLRTQEDMAFADIAETLGFTEDTARWHMMQARRQLMARLDGKLG